MGNRFFVLKVPYGNNVMIPESLHAVLPEIRLVKMAGWDFDKAVIESEDEPLVFTLRTEESLVKPSVVEGAPSEEQPLAAPERVE